MSELYPLLWLDFETTGLDLQFDQLIEVGAFVSSNDLTELYSPDFHAIIEPPRDSYWCERIIKTEVVFDMHSKNGLLKEIPFAQNNRAVGELLTRYLSHMRSALNCKKFTLAGSGVGPFDMQFLRRDWPWIYDEFLTYFVYDVGVVGRHFEMCGYPRNPSRKESNHRALDDAVMEYEEALYYKSLCKVAVEVTYG